ncbi:vacuolar membrane protein-domain-containing protein [Gongronella butleri]|nr:vacuolar membrane protein-domain-containing protein [Gongronella butleri]
MPPPPEDQQGCQLLDSFAIAVQLLLAAIAFSTLLLKRQREDPRRPFRTWGFDVSKQVVGGVVVHSLNLVLSYLFGTSLDEPGSSNPCVWYWLNIFVDTTLGTALIWVFLENGQKLLRHMGYSGFQTGVYGTPPFRKQLRRWAKQLGLYVSSLVMMKFVVVLLFRVCPWLEDVGEWILGWTMGNPKVQVVFVMLITPLVMNIIQFWIIDTIVKHNEARTPIYLDDALDEDILIPIYEEEERLDWLDDEDDILDDDDDDDSHGNAAAPSRRQGAYDRNAFLRTQGTDEQDAISLSASLQPVIARDAKDDTPLKDLNTTPPPTQHDNSV